MQYDGTASPPSPPPADETWTVGEAARYLNGGGVDFRIQPRTVRRWADDDRRLITTVSGGRGRWRRVLASSVRAERARLLAEAGRVDPDGGVPPAG